MKIGCSYLRLMIYDVKRTTEKKTIWVPFSLTITVFPVKKHSNFFLATSPTSTMSSL